MMVLTAAAATGDNEEEHEIMSDDTNGDNKTPNQPSNEGDFSYFSAIRKARSGALDSRAWQLAHDVVFKNRQAAQNFLSFLSPDAHVLLGTFSEKDPEFTEKLFTLIGVAALLKKFKEKSSLTDEQLSDVFKEMAGAVVINRDTNTITIEAQGIKFTSPPFDLDFSKLPEPLPYTLVHSVTVHHEKIKDITHPLPRAANDPHADRADEIMKDIGDFTRTTTRNRFALNLQDIAGMSMEEATALAQKMLEAVTYQIAKDESKSVAGNYSTQQILQLVRTYATEMKYGPDGAPARY